VLLAVHGAKIRLTIGSGNDIATFIDIGTTKRLDTRNIRTM